MLWCTCVDPKLPTVAIGDSEVCDDVPCVGLEEMLQEMNITDNSDDKRHTQQT